MQEDKTSGAYQADGIQAQDERENSHVFPAALPTNWWSLNVCALEIFCYREEWVEVKMSIRLSHKSFVISLSSDSLLAVLWIDLINTHAVITR